MRGAIQRGRRKHDFYPTPSWAADVLWDEIPGVTKHGLSWAEPCVGKGALLRPAVPAPLWTNDIDEDCEATAHFDAKSASHWGRMQRVDWVVTNPPFSEADKILIQALAFARVGVAMLLRLSFLEPTQRRGGLLAESPPDRVLVLPRISFDGSGSTDSVTCAWMIWSRTAHRGIRVVPAKEAA